MPAPPEVLTMGTSVEVSQIASELKKLWDTADGAATRSSLINFAIYNETPDSLGRNTDLISEITAEHACRAIVIAADAAAPKDGVEAWINAHCHVSGAGRKQVCSEQISFLLHGKHCRLLPNIVFAQLDSDLPLYLWWQAEFRAPMDPQLWAWVDRAIYDSQSWDNFDEQMKLLETVQKETHQRIVLCDLNWARLIQLRIALAQFFDHPATHRHLREIKSVAISYAPGFRSTALLLVGWLAGQLGWIRTRGGDSLGFIRKEDETRSAISVSLQEEAGEPINYCQVTAGSAELRVKHEPGADLLELGVTRSNGQEMKLVLPAGRNRLVDLVREELMRGGLHRVYLRAIEKVRDLL